MFRQEGQPAWSTHSLDYSFARVPVGEKNIYKVYLKPLRPPMTFPPLAALVFALANFKFNSSAMMTIRAAEIIQAIIPGT